MAQTAAPPTTTPDLARHVTPAGHIPVQHAPVTPGKVAMWLFLATEIMFFTGLIGSYIVLRAGSPPRSYSNIYSPNTRLEGLTNTQGVFIEHLGSDTERAVAAIKSVAGVSEERAHELAHDHNVINGLTPEKARRLHDELESAGAHVVIEPLRTYGWPKPYDHLTNPLSIDLTAANTFILICSSVAMVLALSAFQRDERKTGTLWLLATTLIGATFLSVQVYEYYQLMVGHHYPPGISATGHFRPSVSLFASCFFTMTGFHGAHVTGGVIALACLTIRSALSGCTAYNKYHYSPVELIGLYWHFVDLVWIILFTVVYLL
jgi:cytochrome c oxidase subunit 3